MEYLSSAWARQHGNLQCLGRRKRHHVDLVISCTFHFIFRKKDALIGVSNVCMAGRRSAGHYFDRFAACSRLALEYYPSGGAISWHVCSNASALASRNGLG